MFHDVETVEEVLKTKVWSIPSAGSLGQVLLSGLQDVQVCAIVGVKRVVSPRRRERDVNCI